MAVLDREEYVEQSYFFRTLRERILEGMPTQEVLTRVGDEILSTTRLPMAVAFLASEIKLTGLLAPAMVRLGHYFTAFQSLVVERAEQEVGSRFSMDQALLVLEREAKYKSGESSAAGLFVYQFEAISRNRLGYDRGLGAMAADPFFDPDWQEYILRLNAKLGDVDFADLIYSRSAFVVSERRRKDLSYQPRLPVLFGQREGKIARANRGRDPLYLFAALQRHLGYPEVPRPRRADEGETRVGLLEQKVMLLENRLKNLESDIRGEVDIENVVVKPDQTAGVPTGWSQSPQAGSERDSDSDLNDLDLDIDTSLWEGEP
jgi:hypothetical protein